MDKYSKVILTIIMFLLIAILLKPGLVSNAKAGSGVTDVNIVEVGGSSVSGVHKYPYSTASIPVRIVNK